MVEYVKSHPDKPFLDGLRSDGKAPQKIRRRKWLRCEQVEVTAPEGTITVEIEGHTQSVTARAGLAAEFAGTNSLLAVNKNNKLKWIADWARTELEELLQCPQMPRHWFAPSI